MTSEIKAGAILNYVSIVVRLATSFLLTPFIISTLGVEEYGLFMLSGSVIAWLALTDLGLGATVSKYVVTYRAKGEHEQQAHFLGQSMMLFALIALITLLMGIICFFHLDVLFPKLDAVQHETLEILFLLTLGNMILAIPLRPLGCVPGAYQKFVVPGVVSLCCSLLNTGLTVALLLLGFKAIGLTVLAVGMGVLNLIWGMFYTLHILKAKVKFSRPDWLLYRGMFGFSLWIFLNQIMDLFYWQAGSPILANVSGTVAVSVFTLGISFSNYFMTASTAISGVLAPKLMHMVALDASKEDLTNVMIRAGRLQLFLLSMILLGFSFLGQDFLRLWVGKSMGDNVATVWLGAITVIIPLIIPLTQNTGLAILQALSIHRGRAIILFYSSLVCVVLGYVLSLFFGPIGMFIGTAVSLTFGQVIMINLYYKRKAGLLIGTFFRRTYLPMVMPGIFLVGIGFALTSCWHVEGWSDLFVAVGVYGVLLVLTLFAFYLNREEKDMFLIPIKKILHVH